MRRGAKLQATPELDLPTHGLYGAIFFDIPVYRLSKQKYEAQQSEYVRKGLLEGGRYAEMMYQRNPDTEKDAKDHLRLVYGGPWLFNEIVGFIRLYFYFKQIRGEYWRVDKRKIVRTRKKVFLFREWKVTYEEEIPRASSSAEIYQLLVKYLERAQAELKNLHVDVSVFVHVGPYVDWKGLFADSVKRRAA